MPVTSVCAACTQEIWPDVSSGFMCAKISKVQPVTDSDFLSSFFPPFSVFNKAFLKPPSLPLLSPLL